MLLKLKEFHEKYLILLFISIFLKITESNSHQTRHRRAQARTLTFPPTAPTRVQFIAGIGIPVEDLLYEAVTSGYVLKAEYFLPERADEFTTQYLRPQKIHRRSASQTTLNATLSRRRPPPHRDASSNFKSNWKNQQKYASTYRWIVYKSIEMVLSSSGLPGRACMLHSICEHATTPLHYRNGILGEILHIILTPSASQDRLSNISDNSYLRAEKFGRIGKNCDTAFRECPKSPIDLITTVLDVDNLIY